MPKPDTAIQPSPVPEKSKYNLVDLRTDLLRNMGKGVSPKRILAIAALVLSAGGANYLHKKGQAEILDATLPHLDQVTTATISDVLDKVSYFPPKK